MTNREEAYDRWLEDLLPAWLREYQDEAACYQTEQEQMDLAIELARRNVAEGTGGPFGAAVFEQDSGRLVAVGVNLVVHTRCSHAHAEMVALGLAQQRCGTYDLGASGQPRHVLATSCEPCAMCLGAIPWSGVRKVITGARDADVRAVGFDEGPKVHDWARALKGRDIEVVMDMHREAAITVLTAYAEKGGPVYNARQG